MTDDERAAGARDGAAWGVPGASLGSEVLREGSTMALYVSLSLVGVMVALPQEVGPASSDAPAAVIFFTSSGLLLAHLLAFRISARLAHRGLLTEHLRILGAQIVAGALVTAVAVVPVLVIGERTGVLVSELLLIGFVGAVAYVASRSVPVSRSRALAYVAGTVVAITAILWIKSLVGH